MRQFYSIKQAKKEMLLFFINSDTELLKTSPVEGRLDYPRKVNICAGTNRKICSSCKFYYLYEHRVHNLDGEYTAVVKDIDNYSCSCLGKIDPESARTLIQFDVDILPDEDYFLKVLPFIMNLYDGLE